MEEYDDIKEALKIPPGADVPWQITQTRLGLALLIARVESLDKRVCAAEQLLVALSESLRTLSTTLPTPKKTSKEPEDEWVWKTKAVTWILIGIGGFVLETVGHAAFNAAMTALKLHLT